MAILVPVSFFEPLISTVAQDPLLVGVGAIFIATLALDKLPKPNNPPQNQMDLLALTIEPIIAFMVMCSILIRESLILCMDCRF